MSCHGLKLTLGSKWKLPSVVGGVIYGECHPGGEDCMLSEG